jgi:hypothetical protein
VYTLRKTAAILFLLVLLFNFYGYRLMIDCMQDRYATLLESQLDKEQYNDDELISIKIRLNLPYYTSSGEYERAYGSAEANGVVYEYVKRRVHLDTLELLCLPNKTKMQLQSVKNELFKLSVDGTSQDKKSNTVKIALPDFCQHFNPFALARFTEDLHGYTLRNTILLNTDYSSKGEQPPELIA